MNGNDEEIGFGPRDSADRPSEAQKRSKPKRGSSTPSAPNILVPDRHEKYKGARGTLAGGSGRFDRFSNDGD